VLTATAGPPDDASTIAYDPHPLVDRGQVCALSPARFGCDPLKCNMHFVNLGKPRQLLLFRPVASDLYPFDAPTNSGREPRDSQYGAGIAIYRSVGGIERCEAHRDR
jgi:hypothetical protein